MLFQKMWKLALFLCLLFLIFEIHHFFIKVHKISIDGLFRLQFLKPLIIIGNSFFLFPVSYLLLLRLLLGNILVKISFRIFSYFGVKLIKTMLFNIRFQSLINSLTRYSFDNITDNLNDCHILFTFSLAKFNFRD